VRWVFIQEHLRHYRVLGELINDAREWLEHPWHNFNSGSKVLINSNIIACVQFMGIFSHF